MCPDGAGSLGGDDLPGVFCGAPLAERQAGDAGGERRRGQDHPRMGHHLQTQRGVHGGQSTL